MSSRKELANAIRALSMDAVQKAKSGHPGAPMGMADIAEVLWRDFLNHNPQNPSWPALLAHVTQVISFPLTGFNLYSAASNRSTTASIYVSCKTC